MNNQPQARTEAIGQAQPLLALEKQASRIGSGITAGDVQGCWALQRVWPKGSQHASAFSSWMLRGLAARLVISHQPGTDQLQMSNAVSLGQLELRFCGWGHLRGKRPLLLFSFDQVQLRVAGQIVLRHVLSSPPSKQQPFFALIHRDPAGWLVARGRGGGLALWELQPHSEAGVLRH